ncbi:ricin-type beta-trefoil lectin domain protein [Kibdelosporangium philippinense]|uniref:Ricin-type beta-trefoil lectin domain protein n=1 Tax=Kibdelosporangium philippinense TaxID=211113 RepID=A0ABS8ZFQ6_9PSEU|nr:ricin-type beta-trefoil lectin domain protein [Kibdelosporangium philippinense]MCE7006668.1 ricin-type beta-trefoil lectin domain protein [Kibdelosporangium philippinense]
MRSLLSGALLLLGVLVAPAVPSVAQPPDTEQLPDSFRTPSVMPSLVTPQSAVCDGDGVSGKRVQAVYVRGNGQADRYAQFAAQFQTFASQIDDVFVEAAARLGGGVRHVRYVHDASCRAVVNNVVIAQSSMASVDSITSAIQAQGYNRSDRKYLVWYDTGGCGLAFGNGGNDSPGANNPYNAGPHYAMMGTGCWTWQASAHELLHTLGAVQRSAPNATLHGHCWDDQDIMCYNDGGIPNPPGNLVLKCANAPENQIDCNGDDYFHTNPPAGSYLATRWNVANSHYLTSGGGGLRVGQITGIGGKCVDVSGSNTANGTPIQLWGCNGTGAQRWTVQSGTLQALGKCMDITSSGTANGTLVQLWDCNGTGAQVWEAQSNGTLRNPLSGRCLDAQNNSSADGTRLTIWDCFASANQIWRLPA